jgi:hypothetical protein
MGHRGCGSSITLRGMGVWEHNFARRGGSVANYANIGLVDRKWHSICRRSRLHLPGWHPKTYSLLFIGTRCVLWPLKHTYTAHVLHKYKTTCQYNLEEPKQPNTYTGCTALHRFCAQLWGGPRPRPVRTRTGWYELFILFTNYLRRKNTVFANPCKPWQLFLAVQTCAP